MLRKNYRCPICHGNSFSEPMERAAYYVGKPEGVFIHRCKTCGTLSCPDYGFHYDSDYFESYDELQPGTIAHMNRHQVFRERVAYFSASVKYGRILDIGCANGDFLDHAAQAGFETFGLEISRDGAVEAQRRGHRVINASAEGLPFGSATFSAVHMNHVLEHLEKPVECLRSIRRILRPGGLAIIEVPNEIGRLAIRVKLLIGRLGVPGTDRERYAPHFVYFNMETLCNALKMADLKVIDRFYRFSGEIMPSLSTLPAMLARFYDRITYNGDQIGVVVTPQ